jgi:hypothetical protein
VECFSRLVEDDNSPRASMRHRYKWRKHSKGQCSSKSLLHMQFMGAAASSILLTTIYGGYVTGSP